MGKYDFDTEFMSEAQIEEMLDAIVGAIAESVEREEEKPAVLNPMKLRQMQFAYGVLKYLTKDTDAKITYQLNQPFRSMGSISVEAKSLSFSNSEWFARSAEFADNTEIYPLENGKVRMTMTFHRLAIPVN